MIDFQICLQIIVISIKTFKSQFALPSSPWCISCASEGGADPGRIFLSKGCIMFYLNTSKPYTSYIRKPQGRRRSALAKVLSREFNCLLTKKWQNYFVFTHLHVCTNVLTYLIYLTTNKLLFDNQLKSYQMVS